MDLKTKTTENYSRYRLAEMVENNKKIGEVWSHTLFIEIDENNHIGLSKDDLIKILSLMEENQYGRSDLPLDEN